ncbi:hypothetical protein WJX74_003889 [Apatococcus lobatus]|uniref:CxC3 like cysteine cluster domain-containing protein n=1 Tax=Apatococcus lobatus TaxID=904363 RepID=A0AAW1REE6_9CHLO
MNNRSSGVWGDSNRARPVSWDQTEIVAKFAEKLSSRNKRRRPNDGVFASAPPPTPEGTSQGQDSGLDGFPEVSAGPRRGRRDRDRESDLLSHEQRVRSSAQLGQQLVLLQAPATARRKQQLGAFRLQQLSAAADEYASRPVHLCGLCEHRLSPGSAQRLSQGRQVCIHFLEGSIHFELPSFQCGCGVFELPPVALMCLGNTPTHPRVLFDYALLDLFHYQSLRKGMSASVMALSLNDVAARMMLLSGSWEEDRPIITAKPLLHAYRASRLCFRSFDDPQEMGVKEYFPGPLGMCPACADLPDCSFCVSGQQVSASDCEQTGGLHSAGQEAGQADNAGSQVWVRGSHLAAVPAAGVGVQGKQRILERSGGLQAAGQEAASAANVDDEASLTALIPRPSDALQRRPLAVVCDGNAKLSHYAKCGQRLTKVYEQNQLNPLMTRFLGDAHKDYQNGPPANQPASQSEAVSQSESVDPQCPVDMSCARPIATSRGACVDEKRWSADRGGDRTTMGFLQAVCCTAAIHELTAPA